MRIIIVCIYIYTFYYLIKKSNAKSGIDDKVGAKSLSVVEFE